MMDANLILDALLDLQKKYSLTYRTTHSLSKNSFFDNVEKITQDDILNLEYRESLLEHVGHLPIIASFLYPYLENSSKVDLGRTLTMLSIHDIAETEMGDVNTFSKTTDIENNEREISKKMLKANYLALYDEYELSKSFDAKFAQSIDKLAPLLVETSQIKVVPEKMKIYPYNVDKIKAKHIPKHSWDTFLTKFSEAAIERFEKELMSIS